LIVTDDPDPVATPDHIPMLDSFSPPLLSRARSVNETFVAVGADTAAVEAFSPISMTTSKSPLAYVIDTVPPEANQLLC
jgi:hypothetical protein